jgi:hypothetical protein
MPLHALYDPIKLDFVRDEKGEPVTTEQHPVPKPDVAGHHWMQVTDEDDTSGPFSFFNEKVHARGEPKVVMRGEHAVRLFPIEKKVAE